MESFGNTLEKVKQKLENVHLSGCNIKFKRTWLSECISWLQGTGNKSIDQFADGVYQQFLHSDMHEIIESSSLAMQVSQIHNQMLTGPYIFQVDELVNISESFEKYDQVISI
jgi:hypothetical protein